MFVGNALVNSLAFSGNNYFFSMLRSSGVDDVNTMIRPKNSYRPHRQNGLENRLSIFAGSIKSPPGGPRLAVLSRRLFSDARSTDPTYTRDPEHKQASTPPSDDRKVRQIAFVVFGVAATGFVAYMLAK